MTFDYLTRVNRSFRRALILSLILHAITVAGWSFYGRPLYVKDRLKEIRITYIKIKDPPAAAPKRSEDASGKSQPQIESAPPIKIVSEETSKAGQPERSKAVDAMRDIPEDKKGELKIPNKPVSERSPAVSINRPDALPKETTASVDLKDSRLVPPSYARTVRSRIIDNLDSDDSKGEGDVFVRFVITSRGELKSISIIDERSSRDGVLRRLAFEAVKSSSPFPEFPKSVSIPEIAFTCQISFLRR